MTLRDDILPIAYEARAIAGELGFRPHSVWLVTKAYSGGHVGDGLEEATETPLTEANGQPPKVRWLTDEERAIGQIPDGAVEIGPITPSFPGGGTDIAALNGSGLANGDVRLIKLVGPKAPNGAYYRIAGIQAHKALRYVVRAVPVGAGEE